MAASVESSRTDPFAGGFAPLLQQEVSKLHEHVHSVLQRDIQQLQERVLSGYRRHVSELLSVVEGLAQEHKSQSLLSPLVRGSAAKEEDTTSELCLAELDEDLDPPKLPSPSCFSATSAEVHRRTSECSEAILEILGQSVEDVDAQVSKVVAAYRQSVHADSAAPAPPRPTAGAWGCEATERTVEMAPSESKTKERGSMSKAKAAAKAMATARAQAERTEAVSQQTSDRIAMPEQELRQTCASCSADFTGDAVYCRICGTKRPEAPACSNCGSTYLDDAVFCRKCGTKRPKRATVVCELGKDADSDAHSGSDDDDDRGPRVVIVEALAGDDDSTGSSDDHGEGTLHVGEEVLSMPSGDEDNFVPGSNRSSVGCAGTGSASMRVSMSAPSGHIVKSPPFSKGGSMLGSDFAQPQELRSALRNSSCAEADDEGSEAPQRHRRPKKSASMDTGALEMAQKNARMAKRSMSSQLDVGAGRASLVRQGSGARASLSGRKSLQNVLRTSRAGSCIDDLTRISERESKLEKGRYDVLLFWSLDAGGGGVRRRASSFGGANMMGSVFGYDENLVERKHNKYLRAVMMHPTSFKRILWDVLGLLMIAWDCIMVPLDMFELPSSSFLSSMEWVQRVYWTANMVLSFALIAYMRDDGMAEMRPWKIAKKYFFSWFPLDAVVVSVDWLEVFIGGFESAGVNRIGTTLRGLRMVRTVRLFRLLKAPELANKMGMYIPVGEKMGLIATIAKIMLFFLWITHCVACVWYGLGRFISQYEESWIQRTSIDDLVLPERYALSFHWSLATFSGDTSIIMPTNVWERLFAMLVLFLAFVVSASVVGGITTSMTRLQIILSEQTSKLTALRRFLKDHHISRPLAVRVQRNAQHAMLAEKSQAPESSIALLAIISTPVLVEVHFEIHSPVLQLHPFMNAYQDVNPAGLRRVCHSAISAVSLHTKDILFSDLEAPEEPTMYFTQSGKLIYAQAKPDPHFFEKGSWMCEACLWTPWTHVGTMRAMSESRLLKLDANKFQDLISTFPSDHAGLYALEFVEWLNAGGDACSDRGPTKAETQEMVRNAWPDDESEEEFTDRHSSMRRLSAQGLSLFRRAGTANWGKESTLSRLARVFCPCIKRKNEPMLISVHKSSRRRSDETADPSVGVDGSGQVSVFNIPQSANETFAQGAEGGSARPSGLASGRESVGGDGPGGGSKMSSFRPSGFGSFRPGALTSRHSQQVIDAAARLRAMAVNRWRMGRQDSEPTADRLKVVPEPHGDPHDLS